MGRIRLRDLQAYSCGYCYLVAMLFAASAAAAGQAFGFPEAFFIANRISSSVRFLNKVSRSSV